MAAMIAEDISAEAVGKLAAIDGVCKGLGLLNSIIFKASQI